MRHFAIKKDTTFSQKQIKVILLNFLIIFDIFIARNVKILNIFELDIQKFY